MEISERPDLTETAFVPCWYELSWDEKRIALILRVHKLIFPCLEKRRIKNMEKEREIIYRMTKNRRLDDFNIDIFGMYLENLPAFSRIFKLIGEKDGFFEYAIEIPKEGKANSRGCMLLDNSAGFTASSLLFSCCQKETDSAHPQLLTFSTVTHMELFGGSIGGKVSIPMADWLMSFGNKMIYLPEVIEAMMIAYRQYERSEADRNRFYASIASGGFIIDCPGNSCGLHPEEFTYIKKGTGFRFSCHNVDNAFQQMLLLVGLAKLCDIARKDILKTTR